MLSAPAAAERLGVAHVTVWRFCDRHNLPLTFGPGRAHTRYRLSAVDVMVLRADLAIRHERMPPSMCEALEHAETAIRSRPRRWLLLTNRNGRITATTHDTAEACGPAWLSRGGVAWLIDLIPEVVS